ncbi:MAG: hypothetical protein K9G62_05830 [Alphaproteobacteria bacterium]|nr:hypothetical protein [Alphaproteobacteria bacterium]
MKKIFIFFLFMQGLSFPVHAQNCEIVPEQIVNLSAPETGTYDIWSALYGERSTDEFFTAALKKDDQGFVAAGERFNPAQKEKEIIAVEFDRRGRAIHTYAESMPDIAGVVQILPADGGWTILANKKPIRKRGLIWIGFFGKDGEKISEHQIEDESGTLEATAFLRRADGFWLTALFRKSDPSANPYSRLYRLNAQGQVMAMRSYMTGLSNGLFDLTLTADGNMLAGGYSYGEQGRRNGWIMKLDPTGGIIWQRQYPRGADAIIRAVADYPENRAVIIGETLSSVRNKHKNGKAAWIMMIDQSNSNNLWQRYITGSNGQDGWGVLTGADGLIKVLVNAAGTKDSPSLARVLTLNAHGLGLKDDVYIKGRGVRAHKLISGPAGENILIGQSKTEYLVEDVNGQKPPENRTSLDGLILAGASLSPGGNPCP